MALRHRLRLHRLHKLHHQLRQLHLLKVRDRLREITGLVKGTGGIATGATLEPILVWAYILATGTMEAATIAGTIMVMSATGIAEAMLVT